MIQPGLRFHQFKKLNPSIVKRFAKDAGDLNPLHHDEMYAMQSSYKGLIASGAQATSLLLGTTATKLSAYGPMVGLEFSFRFRKAIQASEKIKIEMLVVNVTENLKLGGRLVDLRGRILKENGQTALGAKGLILLKNP
ncbi:MAG: MaoC family dehydratase [Cyclobacteriaceae bacterium]